MLDAHDTYKYKYHKYPTKACLLNDKYHRFAHVYPRDVEQLLRSKASNKMRNEFEHFFDAKRTYNDC